MQDRKIPIETIDQYLEAKNYKGLREFLIDYNEIDIAEALEEYDHRTLGLIFRTLPKDMAVDVFAEISVDTQADLVEIFSDAEVKEIIEDLNFDDIIDLLEEVPAGITERILRHTSPEERALVNQFLNYPEFSAGALMTIEYIELRPDMTVRQALDHIKKVGLDTQTVYTCYVLEPNRKLLGYIGLRVLVTAAEDQLIGDLFRDDVIKVHTLDDQEDVANIFSRYGFVALPVVDSEDRMVGVITIDDILEVIEQEATEDMQVMAGVTPSEEDYMDTSVIQHAKNRLPWLLFLTISSVITGNIMRSYESVLSVNTVLSAFIPMVMATGGNSGSQASTLVIRGLATGSVTTLDGLKVLWKEFRIAILSGLVIATVNFIRLLVYDRVGNLVALVVSVTAILTMIIAKLIGGLLPIVAEKINLDPAIMAGPLITTAVDAISLIIYFVTASAILGV